MTKVYDVTMPITLDMPVYKNKPEKRPEFVITSDHADKGVRESRIALDVHTGTHIDAPLHMIAEGATIESIQVTDLMGVCKVLDLTHVENAISQTHLQPLGIQAGDFVLLKTRNSSDSVFNPEFVFLDEDGARYLAGLNVKGVGIDALGVERSQPTHPTHKALFGAGVIVIEGLRLADVPPGTYQLIALPLSLIGLDASPARVVLIAQE